MTEHLFDDPRITAMGLLTEAFTGLTARFSEQLASQGMSIVEFEVLIRLARSPQSQLRMTDLAAQTQLTTSGITRVVDRLERAGLVRREACPTDRRSSFAVMTDAGQTRMEEVLPGHIEVIDYWFTSRLTPERLTQLLDSLRVVRDAVRPGATSGAGRVTGAGAAGDTDAAADDATGPETTTGRSTGRT